MGLPDGEEIFLRFDTIPARDGQTDRQTDGHVAVAKTRARVIVFTDAVRVNVVCVEARSVTVQASG